MLFLKNRKPKPAAKIATMNAAIMRHAESLGQCKRELDECDKIFDEMVCKWNIDPDQIRSGKPENMSLEFGKVTDIGEREKLIKTALAYFSALDKVTQLETAVKLIGEKATVMANESRARVIAKYGPGAEAIVRDVARKQAYDEIMMAIHTER